MKHYLLLIMLITLTWAGCQSPSSQESQESETTSDEITIPISEVSEVILENEYVRVMQITLESGQKIAPHEGLPRTILSLNDYTIDWMEEGEEKGEKSWNSGDVHWHEGGMHAARNIGEYTARFAVIARKATPMPACEDDALEQDIHEVAPDKAEIIFENEHVRAIQVTVPAGELIPEHAGRNRVIYSLSSYDMDYRAEGEEETSNTYQMGDAHWHETCRHSLTNPGDTEAHFIVFALKQ